MEVGKKYRIEYLIPGIHRVARGGVAVCLEWGPTVTLSGRPVFGTTEISQDHIISWERVTLATKCYMGRRLPPIGH